jgi:hypothetical protein
MYALFYLILILTLINCNLFEINAQNWCESVADCSGSEKICFKNKCKCGPNYRLNTTLHNCEHFDCSEDTECQEFDENRKCLDQKCDCDEDFKENSDTKYVKSFQKSVLIIAIVKIIVIRSVSIKYVNVCLTINGI